MNKENIPQITVLMAVHDGEQYLREAIESILGQTFTDFEFLIIDDGSADRSADIVRSYRDERVRPIKNERNIGLSESLNKGLRLARGEYIVRMDADDISLPERLAEQFRFMQDHPNVGVAGSWIELIGNSEGEVREYPLEHESIICHLLFQNIIVHPSVIMRKQVLLDNNLFYDPQWECAQDYDLWVRAARKTRIANIPRVLLRYRSHEAQVGKRFWKSQRHFVSLVCRRQLNELGIKADDKDIMLHRAIGKKTPQISKSKQVKVSRWIQRLITANKRAKIYPEPQFSKILKDYQKKTSGSVGNIGTWLVRRLKSLLN